MRGHYVHSADMTSSTKPKVHSISQHRQGKTEPQSQETFVENLVKFRHLVFEMWLWADRHTDTPVAIPCNNNRERRMRL